MRALARVRQLVGDPMYSYILQDWTTLMTVQSIGTLTQSEGDWLSFQAYQDIIFYTEIKNMERAGADDVKLFLQTSPSKDESMFKTMATVSFLADAGTVAISKVILATNPDVPLSRWVRWQLALEGTAASAWGGTFRVLCAANAVGPL